MKISYNWLKEYIDLSLSAEETAEKLTLLGLEVEEIEHIGSGFEGFVVGDVINVRKHPNADKLSLCDVNLGSETVQIACGAKNVAAGQKVPVATIGSTLPVPMDDGRYLTIKKAKLRGEVSEGMICSEAELGLSDDHSGIMVLDDSLNAGKPLTEALQIEQDTVFEIGLTPNRPDASCHIGVARDLSAVLDLPLRNPYREVSLPDDSKGLDSKISIRILDTDKCGRYAALMVDNVSVGESPPWLKNRLLSIGLRPINNVVDVTNFVLHEIGQPLHAFDYELIRGHTIEVRSFDKAKEFTTLDSVSRSVPPESLFICDDEGPVAIAGVMGGENSEVNENTSTILIESAWFNPSSIRKTSKQLALQTDSSYRFERGVDPTIQLKAAHRAAKLIAELSGGEIIGGQEDIHPVEHEPKQVSLRIARLNHVLGSDITSDRAAAILKKLEFKIEANKDETLVCKVPLFRPDVAREIDLIEEVGRVYDYNNIPRPETAPFIAPEPLSEVEKFQQKARKAARSLGYKEISTDTLLSGKEAGMLADETLQIQALNPVSQENTTLRTHLEGGFLKAAAYNLNRNAETLRFFEIGHTFQRDQSGTWIEGVKEEVHLLMGLCGTSSKENWQDESKPFTVFDLKADLESFLNFMGFGNNFSSKAESNHVLLYTSGKEEIATLKRTDRSVMKGFDVDEQSYTAEINLSALYNLDLGTREIRYKPVSRYPVFEFDAAFVVDTSVRAGIMQETIRKEAGTILHNVTVFDIYEGENLGENKKSIAFRLTFLDSNKTLTIKDVEPVVQKIVQSLEKEVGAILRS
ncbi:phenylalanine--tRNA ligase subunit beta [Rhodohalobacter mucosus]|uniref:Phenylalanine--tRNA ligase beta subunit n=1 Tax=Rhodohalobacter mucosus TaxID=2079485 RepID=A0A316TVY8_9BACT|nr:phenylalanine--tRNA ligase subunit beta [Rhodohalobacter mucosus]PWN07529.1 phenylalanine--tRNA ligase subunit beta [Rhodohalobacter mucosus]